MAAGHNRDNRHNLHPRPKNGELPRKHHHQQHLPRASHRGRRQNWCRVVLLYILAGIAVCWLQITANVLAFFWSDGRGIDPAAGGFLRHGAAVQLPPAPPGSPTGGPDPNHGANSTSNRAAVPSDPSGASPGPDPSSLRSQLKDLRSRLEKTRDRLEKEAGDRSGHANGGKKRRVFVPFTIRDAQRTVPVKVPPGFHVFDFVDLYATDGDQNQTAKAEASFSATHRGEGTEFWKTLRPYASVTAGFFHNGRPLPPEPRAEGEDECLGYSKKCYRSKFLRILRYLLSLEEEDADADADVDRYYFYMEADNDLCIPLEDLADLAYGHHRYFVSTGVGASGWIMSPAFLRDFYGFWTDIEQQNDKRSLGLAEDQMLEPDAVAAVMLRETKNWSVTRRYLTSHSILASGTGDAPSLAALYVREEAKPPNATDSAAESSAKPSRSQKTPFEKLKALADEAKAKPPTEPPGPILPARYLPRCLEPHRGVWPEGNGEAGGEGQSESDADAERFGRHHWEYFDYDLCPESDIFPCGEGQLR